MDDREYTIRESPFLRTPVIAGAAGSLLVVGAVLGPHAIEGAREWMLQNIHIPLPYNNPDEGSVVGAVSCEVLDLGKSALEFFQR